MKTFPASEENYHYFAFFGFLILSASILAMISWNYNHEDEVWGVLFSYHSVTVEEEAFKHIPSIREFEK